MKRLGKFGVTLLMFLFSFLFFLYFMLPMDAVKQRVIAMVAPSLGPDMELSVNEMSTYRLTGLRMEGVTLFQKGGDRGGCQFSLDSRISIIISASAYPGQSLPSL